MREHLAVVTRPQVWAAALGVAEVTADTDTFSRRFRILEDGPAVWAELMEPSRNFQFGGRQVHDSNIVATFGSLIKLILP